MTWLYRLGISGAALITANLMFGCSPLSGEDLKSIPSTFTGTLKVMPQGRQTKELYLGLLKLSKHYGLEPRGDGATGGREWQLRFFCGEQYVGGGTTAGDGDLFLFQLAIYGFKEAKEYERFKVDFLAQMKSYGGLSSLQDRQPLSQSELLERGRHTGFDVTSKCGPASDNPFHQ
jgi:hypothetical protein